MAAAKAYARMYFLCGCATVIAAIAWLLDGLLEGDMSHWYWKLLLLLGGSVWAWAYWRPALQGKELARIQQELDAG